MNIYNFIDEILSNGSKIAINDINGSFSYNELIDYSKKIAANLQAHNVNKGDRVIIDLDRTKECVGAFFGVLLCGAVAVPLNSLYPEERKDYIRKDSKSKLNITEEFIKSLDKSLSFNEITIDNTDEFLILYTSGSTGNPKGVIQTHETFLNAIYGEVNYFNSINDEPDRIYKFGLSAPFSFIASWFFICWTLLQGNSVYIVPISIAKDVNDLCNFYNENQIDAIFISPRVVNFILQKCNGLKFIYSGGERVSNLYSSTTKIINIYGSSESMPGITHYLVDKLYENTPIGKINNFIKGYILDDENNEVSEGELCITGNLFKGYENLDEQTKKVLFSNPFRERDGFPDLYRTGDLCKIDDDGNITLLNRKDWMIKVNGQRVEPLEIESVLKNIKGIDEAAVKDFVGPNKQTFITAYYVSSKNIDESFIFDELNKKLPDYMIPAYLIKLDSLPLNINGKLDRKSLVMPSISSYKQKYVAPIGNLEEKIASGFATVLKTENVGRFDDFFYLGGDSIKAMELQTALKDLDIPTRAIYEGRTVEKISLLVSDSNDKQFVHIEQDAYKLSSSQLGVYLDYLKEPSSLKYNNPFIIKLGKETDVAKLKDSINKSINNHDCFKCVVDDYDGFPCMIKKNFNFEIQMIQGNIQANLQKIIQPFDLKNGPLYRCLYINDKEEYYLFLDFHHVIFDGTTLGIILREIEYIYRGKQIEKEEFSIFDMSHYEELIEQSEEYLKSEQLFNDDFSDLECQNSFALDKDSNGNEADEINVSINNETDFLSIVNFAKNKGIAENTLFLAAFLYTLSIFNGDEKAFACAGENGRHNAKLSSTGGMFVKNIPMYFDMTKYSSVDDLLFSVENKFRLYVNNDVYPFSKLATKFGISNDYSFVYQGDSFNSITLDGNKLYLEKIKVDSAISNLELMAFKKDNSYDFNFTYRSDLFNSSVIESFAESYVHILREFITKNDFDKFILISPILMKKFEKVNDRNVDYDHVDMVCLFNKSVEKYPNNVAVNYENKNISYLEANKIANKIANYILSLKINNIGVVGILIPRNEYMLLASLGALKSGLGFQPLDSTYPQERLNFMLADSGAEILITTKELRPLVNEYNGNILYLEDIESLENDKEPNAKISPSDIFVMLYTSGTTGKPKGVILEHRNFVSFFNYDTTEYKIDSNSRVACYASYGFDASVKDLFAPMTAGGAAYIVPEEIRLNLDVLNKYYIENKITHGVITTQVGRKFYEKTDSKYMKCLIVGGEKLVPIYKEDGINLINGYGPTETTVYVTSFKVDKLYKRVPIGKVNTNCKGYVVDKYLRLLPFGAPGELLIAGEQVGRGYHNRDEVTKKVFIKNPFSNDPKYNYMYRTGDIVRLYDDGNFDFVGRNDGQVKIRGFRVELSEVEKIIREFNKIKDAAVVDYDKPSGGKFIAAYIVGDEEINIDELKNHILKNKPPYMVPEVIMQIDKIPLNQNQKLNKKALPAPVFSNKPKKEISHSDSLIVSALKEYIKKITGDDSAQYDDNLFEYGLTSISLMELLSNINNGFKVSLSIKDLLDDCSYKNIEKLIILSLMNNGSNEEKACNSQEKSEYLLSETQSGLYVEYVKDRSSLNYNVPVYRCFTKQKYPNITVEKLRSAVVNVFNAHKPLKCTISTNENNQIVMIPHDNAEVSIDLFEGNAKDLENFKDNFIQPFDLEKSIYHISIFSSENISLFMDIHHIMFDGFSLNVFMSELDDALSGKEIKEESYSIYDVAINEKKKLSSAEFNKAKEYFDILLADVDGSTQIIEECYITDSKKEEIDISGDTVDIKSLNKLISDKGLSTNVFFLAAFGAFLNKYTYSDISCFATIYNGRNDLREMNTMGMLVKTLPFVSSLSNNPTVEEYLLAAKKQILDSMANDIYSFANISKEHNVVTDLMFIYQGKYADGDCKGLPLKDVKSPLAIEVRDDDQKLYFHVEYDAGKYSQNFVRRLIKSFEICCKTLINSTNINEIELFDDDDKSEIFKAVTNNVAFDKTPIISLIEHTMEAYPNKVSVVYENVSLTYKELNTKSRNIAGYIASLNIKNEDVVAIMVPRSVFMVLCSVGVLRSGAGYQPLDSSYPKDRLNFMIQDSGAKLLITTKELRNVVDEYNGPVLFVEDIDKLTNINKLNVQHNLHDRFIMLYTSGTTGTPKGVILENINLSALVAAYSNSRQFNHEMVSSSYASFGFDACLLDFYPTLLFGGTIHILSEDLRLNFPKLIEYFEENKITTAAITTQVGRQIATSCKSKYLKSIGMGGEKLVPFDPKGIPFKVYNQYGPSECTSYSNEALVDKLYKRLPIGKCNQNLKVYVVDKDLHLLPIGATGELIIAGLQVGRGYLNRPEKTSQVFIDNPFDSDPNYRKAYCTGDVVRMLENGAIDFIGRNDGQVKVRGFRIELSEVEEIIRRFPNIKDVTTNAYDDPAGGKFIAAYIVSDEKINISDLNNFILSEKPSYIVPKITMQIDKIPLNVNSKVDKRKLPVPDLSSMQSEYVKPANDLEKEFCDLFAEILGLNKVGATDDFFALGGSSIGAAQIVGHAFTKGYDIVFKNVFENSTPRALSEFIAKNNNLTLEQENDETASFKEILEPCFKNNIIPNLGDIKIEPLNGVVLLGATGFLGMHVLKELLDNTDEKVICIIRENDINSPLDRLLIMLEYYFENTYEDLLEKRLFVVKGDLLDENLGDKLKEFEYNTIINCAASVKHFSNDDSIQKTNAGGVANLINIALKGNKKLIHISTLSVAGESVNNSIPHDFKMKETMLYFGQSVDNKYIKSKFDAENEIRDAINKGLRAKIIRVGNLMSRHSDGEFQINFYSNNFMNTLRAFQLMECIPYENLIQSIEFSQIDLVARAITLLSQIEDRFNVFHVNNIHSIQTNNVVDEFNKNNVIIKRVSNEYFLEKLNKVIETTKDTQTMNSLLAYRTNKNEKRFMIETDNSFTLDVLYRLGFVWPLPDNEYLEKLINSLIGLDFFERKD